MRTKQSNMPANMPAEIQRERPSDTPDNREAIFSDLRQANARLEQMSRYKSQFIVNMSHELRTPLNAIIGFSELLADDIHAANLDPRHQAYVGHILESGRHLLALINDVLDMSRIEAGRVDLHCQWISLRELALRAAEIVHP